MHTPQTDTLHIDGWVQDCSNSSALAMELLQYCTKPSTCRLLDIYNGIHISNQGLNELNKHSLHVIIVGKIR